MTPSNNSKPSSGDGRRPIPWPFILIVTIITVPIVAAYVAYYTGMGVSDETVNNGFLLQPPVKLTKLMDRADGAVPDVSERKWRLLLPVTVPCDSGCEENLYTTRQVHIRLGEKGLRVERLAANIAGAEGEALLEGLQESHPKLKHFTVSRADWDAWLAQTNAPDSVEQTPFYLLVDQEGYAMMYYTQEHHGNELLDDIKRVLRYTPE